MVQDLQVDAEENPSNLCFHIKSSETDPFQQHCFIYLGRGQASLCPIAATMSLSQGPLFIDRTGQPLTQVRLSSFFQSTLAGAGIPGQFSGHSFRIGTATTAAQRGIPDHLIKTMGRWMSDAYKLCQNSSSPDPECIREAVAITGIHQASVHSWVPSGCGG